MVTLVNEIPEFKVLNAECVKIKCLYNSYNNDDKVMFWVQDSDKCIIALTDGNMIIYNVSADLEELS